MRHKRSKHRHLPQRNIPGFTLVEMLVAVALVLLMMTMFAQIFQMATGSLSTQKGIAENDQRERLVVTTLRGDLDKRTFRDVFPFNATTAVMANNGTIKYEDTRALVRSLTRRSGYFEIYEGDPNSDIDDYLQFTTSVNIKLMNKDGTPYTGKCTNLFTGNLGIPITGITNNLTFTVSTAPTTSTNAYFIWISGSTGNDGRYLVTSSGTTITINQFASQPLANTSSTLFLGSIFLEDNEPDSDDGVYGNQSSVSTAAEICYFLRNGNLYRRVLLIRDPAPGSDSQPTSAGGSPLLWNVSTTGTENYGVQGGAVDFWRDFDYSAFYFNGIVPNVTAKTVSGGVRFHNTSDSLSNSSDAPANLQANSIVTGQQANFPMSLGIPNLRYGHSYSTGFGQDMFTPVTRFTLQECANSAFGYPGYMPVVGGQQISPFENVNLTLDPATGLVSQFETDAFVTPPPRRGEDILLSNVLTFDVKVWDPVNSAFVDIGDSTLFPSGPFGANAPAPASWGGSAWLNSVYGGIVDANLNPISPPRYRFDTWHPLASISFNSGGAVVLNNRPPLVPLLNATSLTPTPFMISALQITINFKDISSNQVRQTTIVQSLVDQIKSWPSTTNEPPEE